MDTLGYIEILVRVLWLAGAVCFVLGLVRMNSPATARNGNLLSAGGMAVAIAVLILAASCWGDGFSPIGWAIILIGIAIGGGLGLYAARTVKMTAMPQLVSLFNAVGGGAAALIAIEDYLTRSSLGESIRLDTNIFIVLDIIIGSITFSGSLIASGKLQGLIPGQPILIPGGQSSALALAAMVVAAVILFDRHPERRADAGDPRRGAGVRRDDDAADRRRRHAGRHQPAELVHGHGRRDGGLRLDNPVLIIAGALVGASGAILTKLMADAMNRSVLNIMIGGFGGGEGTVAAPAATARCARSASTTPRSSSRTRRR